jgi:hypothetical protein
MDAVLIRFDAMVPDVGAILQAGRPAAAFRTKSRKDWQ